MINYSTYICYAAVEEGDIIHLRGKVTAKDNHKITLGYRDRYHNNADKSITIDCDQWHHFHGSRQSTPTAHAFYITPKERTLLADILQIAINGRFIPEETATLQTLHNRLTNAAYSPTKLKAGDPVRIIKYYDRYGSNAPETADPDDPFYPSHYILTDDQATVLEDEGNHGYVKVRLDRNDSVFYIHRANLELLSE